MSRPANISKTVTVIPSGYTGASNLTAGTGSYVPENSYHDHTWTTNYARWTLGSSNTSTVCYVYYTFDTSAVPSNATITSVTATVKAYRNNRVTQGTAGVQLYANTTAKGSAVAGTLGTSATTVNITNGGSWTRSELNNLRLRLYGVRSSTSYTGYLYLYGASVTINYSVSGTEYEVTSTLATDAIDSIDPAGLTYVWGGEDYELKVYTDSLDNITIEDNGTDVTSSLVYTSQQAGSFTFTGIPVSFDETNSSYNKSAGTNGVYDTNYITNGLTDHNSSTRCALYTTQGSGVSSYMYYNFDCTSIPEDITVTSVSCQFKGGTQGTNYYSTYTAQLCSGTTTKGSSVSVTGSNSSPTTVTINGGSSWTREELDNLKLKFQVTRGNSNTTTDSTFSFFGATVTINYTTQATTYYKYTLSNVNADHTITISDAIIEIPEEDPQYDYYPITISSINATTTPGRGTTRVVEGTNQTITIYPDDPQLTLATDNGSDISSQLVQHGGTIPDPTVATATGASYGFTLNSSTGYYTSANTGVDKSAAVCRVSFNLPVRCLVTINYINYAEATYDFGVFGNIDTALNTNYYAAGSNGATITDTSYKLACNTSSYNTSSVQTITYEIPSGQHYIDIKYSKDDGTSSNNDSLQWKIASIEPLENNNYYTYTLNNIQEAHSLIFVFGNVTYYMVNSSSSGAKLFPNGSMVHLQGDSYRLTIVPNDYTYNVSVTDNNVNVSSQVQRKEEQVTKDGNTYTVVNFIYNLTNIQATHTIEVICTPNESLHVKLNGGWVQVTKIYRKVNNVWTEVTLDSLTEPNIYIMK